MPPASRGPAVSRLTIHRLLKARLAFVGPQGVSGPWHRRPFNTNISPDFISPEGETNTFILMHLFFKLNQSRKGPASGSKADRPPPGRGSMFSGALSPWKLILVHTGSGTDTPARDWPAAIAGIDVRCPGKPEAQVLPRWMAPTPSQVAPVARVCPVSTLNVGDPQASIVPRNG